MERLGLGYERVRAIRPDVIYGVITGYGDEGPWRGKPGQDLPVQSLSGRTWLSGDAGDGPVAMGLAIVDFLAGAQLVQGILSCLVRRSVTGEGGLVEVSMLEAILDYQFEPLTVYLQDGGQPPRRTATNNAHAYLGAPYGIYGTADGHIALAMGGIPQLGELLDCEPLVVYPDPDSRFSECDAIKAILARHLMTRPTSDWLARLQPADVWCAEVLDWNRLRDHEGYQVLGMEQTVPKGNGPEYTTTRSPIRFDGERLYSERGAPRHRRA